MPTQTRPPKYLVCVDDRPPSRVALRLACAKAAARNGRVVILHVIPAADAHTLHTVADRLREEQRAAAEALVEKLAAEAREFCGINPGICLREGGTAGEAIVSAAMEDYDASMLVLGVAEQSASRGRLIGWLASQLGAQLLIPMLLVPGNLTDQQLQNLI